MNLLDCGFECVVRKIVFDLFAVSDPDIAVTVIGQLIDDASETRFEFGVVGNLVRIGDYYEPLVESPQLHKLVVWVLRRADVAEKASAVKHDRVVHAFDEIRRNSAEPPVEVDAARRAFDPNDTICL